jgi:hypothetical protein
MTVDVGGDGDGIPNGLDPSRINEDGLIEQDAVDRKGNHVHVDECDWRGGLGRAAERGKAERKGDDGETHDRGGEGGRARLEGAGTMFATMSRGCNNAATTCGIQGVKCGHEARYCPELRAVLWPANQDFTAWRGDAADPAGRPPRGRAPPHDRGRLHDHCVYDWEPPLLHDNWQPRAFYFYIVCRCQIDSLANCLLTIHVDRGVLAT